MNKEKMVHFHRENILDSANSLFKKYGYESTTMAMIAKKSEYSKPTLYAYFDSKAEIFACNLYKLMLLFKDNFEESLSSKGSVDDIYLRCCHIVFDFKCNYPVYFSGLIGNFDYKTQLIGEDSYTAINQLGDSINKKVSVLYEQAISEGFIKQDIDINTAYNYIWSCVMGIVDSIKLKKTNFANEIEWRDTVDKYFLMIIDTFKEEKVNR